MSHLRNESASDLLDEIQRLRIALDEEQREHDTFRANTRQLDINDDAMVLFLKAAQEQGFTIQLVPSNSTASTSEGQ